MRDTRFVDIELYIHCETLITKNSTSPGTCLETKMNSNTATSLGEVRNISEQLLVALDYLHSNSVVHKNLKVSTVLALGSQLFACGFDPRQHHIRNLLVKLARPLDGAEENEPYSFPLDVKLT